MLEIKSVMFYATQCLKYLISYCTKINKIRFLLGCNKNCLKTTVM